MERPVAFASRTLTQTERNYTQVKKEAAGIIFGVKKFHKYLYGRKFRLITEEVQTYHGSQATDSDIWSEGWSANIGSIEATEVEFDSYGISL